MLQTINKTNFKSFDDTVFDFNYLPELTLRLDSLKTNFNQSTVNKIVLWKVNRYAELNNDSFTLINSINPNARKIDEKESRIILIALLKTKGIGLPMASTLLRFKNPKIYQIIDQRVYRIIYGKHLKLSNRLTIKNIENQIDLYFEYLVKLRNICKQLSIPFCKSDRILYEADKKLNNNVRINNH